MVSRGPANMRCVTLCCFTTQEEFDNLRQWFMSPGPQPEHSWQAWNAESWKAAADATVKQMGRLGLCVRAHIFKLPTLVMVLAAVARMKAKDDSLLPKWAVALILAGAVLNADHDRQPECQGQERRRLLDCVGGLSRLTAGPGIPSVFA
jgi:hypothetical protein